MKRRLKLTVKEYRELIECRDWCAVNGMPGFREYYDELLEFHARRRALPAEAFQNNNSDEERFYQR